MVLLLQWRCFCEYHVKCCKVFFFGEKTASARQISLSDKGFPSHMFQENTAIHQWPQRSLGCVAEFSVEILDILILTCRCKELFQSGVHSHLKSTFS